MAPNGPAPAGQRQVKSGSLPTFAVTLRLCIFEPAAQV
jgi:hypothetical protein